MTFFSHRPFLYDFLAFRIFSYFTLQMTPPIPIFCTLYTPCIRPIYSCVHTHMLFSRFCTLLAALVTVDTAYTIYFFLIHHCTAFHHSTFSFITAHFVHHCTLKQALIHIGLKSNRSKIDSNYHRRFTRP